MNEATQQEKRAQKLLDFIIDNVMDLITIGFALFIFIRHQITPYIANDLDFVTSALLGILTMIAVSGLWNRNRRSRRIEEKLDLANDLIKDQLRQDVEAIDFFNDTESPAINDDNIGSAQNIYILGITLARTTRDHMHIISEKVQAGATVHLALLDPKNDALMKVMAARSMGETDGPYWETRLGTVRDVIRAMVPAGQQFENATIGFLPFIPSFGLIITDPDEPHGSCTVEIYHHRTAEKNATFELNARRDPFWYSFFIQQWREAWKCARYEAFRIEGSDSDG